MTSCSHIVILNNFLWQETDHANKLGSNMKDKMKARMKNRRNKKPAVPQDIKPGSAEEEDYLRGKLGFCKFCEPNLYISDL